MGVGGRERRRGGRKREEEEQCKRKKKKKKKKKNLHTTPAQQRGSNLRFLLLASLRLPLAFSYSRRGTSRAAHKRESSRLYYRRYPNFRNDANCSRVVGGIDQVGRRRRRRSHPRPCPRPSKTEAVTLRLRRSGQGSLFYPSVVFKGEKSLKRGPNCVSKLENARGLEKKKKLVPQPQNLSLLHLQKHLSLSSSNREPITSSATSPISRGPTRTSPRAARIPRSSSRRRLPPRATTPSPSATASAPRATSPRRCASSGSGGAAGTPSCTPRGTAGAASTSPWEGTRT